MSTKVYSFPKPEEPYSIKLLDPVVGMDRYKEINDAMVKQLLQEMFGYPKMDMSARGNPLPMGTPRGSVAPSPPSGD